MMETLIGLEVHVTLNTLTKLFCPCPATHTAPPNTCVCPICTGYPGTLPAVNRTAVEKAIMAGLALQCQIAPETAFDRKHYFYPDLPKGYQITQHDKPLATNGHIRVLGKTIPIMRLQLEEDAGKLFDENGQARVDYNRAGMPLIEIVTAAAIHTGAEAAAVLQKIRATMVYAGLSHGRMNEGDLRCDVNLSVHEKGTPPGTRVEIKNLNSIKSVRRAIEVEAARMTAQIKAGQPIQTETRWYDAAKNQTHPARKKETQADYRFLQEPDIPQIQIEEAEIAALQAALPPLPDEIQAHLMARYCLDKSQSELLVSEKWAKDVFETACQSTNAHQTLAKLITGELFRLMQRNGAPCAIAPVHLAKTASLIDEGRLSHASGRRIVAALYHFDEPPQHIADRESLWQLNDEQALMTAAREAVTLHPELTAQIMAGKQKAFAALMGAAMAQLGGRGNPVRLHEMLHEMLQKA